MLQHPHAHEGCRADTLLLGNRPQLGRGLRIKPHREAFRQVPGKADIHRLELVQIIGKVVRIPTFGLFLTRGKGGDSAGWTRVSHADAAPFCLR